MNTKAAGSNVQYDNTHQELLDGCRRGEQKAQFQIYKLYYKAMYNISLRIVKDPMEAEDIMQESFLAGFEKLESYSGQVSFGAWLKKIVQNKSIDFLNKKNILVYEDIEEFKGLEDPGGNSSENEDAPDPRIRKILDNIMLLPYKYRNVLSLYLFEGYDHEEIGQIMSVPSSTSRSNFSRARRRLVCEIEGRGKNGV